MADPEDDHIVCATYTHARRHPLVLGRIAGWTPPFQLSLTQLAVIVVAFWLEMRTWRWWAGPLPRVYAMAVAVGVPCLLAWAVRRTRWEGRSLPRTLLGWASWLAAPRRGRVGGRPCRPGRPVALGWARVLVAPGGDEVGAP